MQHTTTTANAKRNSNRSYSDFFTSGFRAMASRASRRCSPLSTTTGPGPGPAPSITSTTTTTTTSSTRRTSFRGISRATRHARTTSMIGFPPSTHSHSHSPSHTHGETPPRDRRSSIASFSSWLFDRRAPADGSFTFSPSPQKNARELHRDAEIMEVWITAGGPYTPSSISRDTADSDPDTGRGLFQTIDPFASSPESKSFFIDLSESPSPPPYPYPSPSPAPKRESFLSFTPSPDRSFLHLPRPRRERPTSVQTMPLPSRSRRSSYRAKCDDAWPLPEEHPPPPPAEDSRRESLAEDADWADPAHDMDWRQFHVELLAEEA